MKALHQIGTLAGIPIRVHALTYTLPLLALGYGLWRGLSVPGMMWLEVLVLGVLVCVLLHELGHALAARYFNVGVHDVLLLPVGGAARLEKLPRTAAQESFVVFAGPLVNLLIGLLLLPAAYFLPESERFLWEGNFTAAATVASLAVFNLIVFVVNLVPIFPLDGGRLLRSVLTNWMPRLRATEISSIVARLLLLIAIAFVVWRGDYLFVLLFGYLFVLAGREVHMASVQHFLEGDQLGQHAYAVRVFDPGVPICDILHQLERNAHTGAVIADECCPIGFVTVSILRAAPNPHVHVGDLEMLTVVCHDSYAPLKELSRQFACHPKSVAIEEIDGRPAGYLDLDGLTAAFEQYQERD